MLPIIPTAQEPDSRGILKIGWMLVHANVIDSQGKRYGFGRDYAAGFG
jgi:hypothetical protein